MDPITFKENERKSWASVAPGWQRRDELLKNGAAAVTERMLTLASIDKGHRVLDVASGTGEPAIPAAVRVGEQGRVIGTDFADEMLAIARDKAAKHQLTNIEFRCMDGETLQFTEPTFDAATIRWGLMFMPDPQSCLRKVYRLLKNDGKIVIACWASPERNPFLSVFLASLKRHTEIPTTPPNTPGIFAFAEPARLSGLLAECGYIDVSIEEMEINIMDVADGSAYWQTMQDLAGPLMRLVEKLDAQAREAFVQDLIQTADALRRNDRLRLPGTTWIATGTRPDEHLNLNSAVESTARV
jgi:ubiquinone/menaquinone biosynthesis C-methylase UbiE